MGFPIEIRAGWRATGCSTKEGTGFPMGFIAAMSAIKIYAFFPANGARLPGKSFLPF
ncbi:MAG: hypothetical protein ABR999_10690 [Methanoregula sp.]|uniref:hypothetical protein n=1 Tax=Methanoregula sp. TaxID=2052170 RepID=UPI003D144B75